MLFVTNYLALRSSSPLRYSEQQVPPADTVGCSPQRLAPADSSCLYHYIITWRRRKQASRASISEK